MRVLFFVHVLGRTRHFKNVISGLLERQHTVILAPASGAETEKARKGLYAHPQVEVAPCPTGRSDRWAAVMEPLRRSRDHLRFFDPRYAHAVKLAERAAENAPQTWKDALARHPWMTRYWRPLQRALALAEAVVPCDPGFERFVASLRPDVLLVTPLVEFGSYQTEYVKCAHRLGIPVLYLPFSWDNLTNRGLVRVAPDRTLVWNVHQQREAVDLHGLPDASVVVTGAPRFDEFFRMRPTSERDAFCGGLGLDPRQPLLLYLCSSGFVAPRELGFVRHWIGELRRGGRGTWLEHCSILIRPHPAYLDEWTGADVSDLPGVAVWSEKSSMQADQRLFESLFHAAAVVGLNTSAMIEAAIVRRPVFTIATPEFAGGQAATFHWWYLLAEHGGVVTRATSLAEHVQQLREGPGRDEEVAARSAVFLRAFVRPRGIDVPASDVMVEEVERAARTPKSPRSQPAWHTPARWALQGILRAGGERLFVKGAA
jgi:hypothetical protein